MLERLVIKNCYGFISKDISFNEDINILVGINGSGKTTILNIINWLMTPCIKSLSSIDHKLLELTYNYKNSKYTVSSKRTNANLIISLKINDEKPKVARFPMRYLNDVDDNILFKNFYHSNHIVPSDFGVSKLWDFWNYFVENPIVIGLDRFTDSEDQGLISWKNSSGRNSKKEKLSALDSVNDLTKSVFRDCRNKHDELNKSIQNELLLSSFKSLNENDLQVVFSDSPINLKMVETIEKKVIRYFQEYLKDTDMSIIQSYFTDIKALLLKKSQPKDERVFDLLSLVNANQLERINNLIGIFKKLEQKSSEIYRELNAFLDTINAFLVDSNKKLIIDRVEGVLKYYITNTKIDLVLRDIKTLSSGEQQILTLMTFIKYKRKTGKIFIIDEPELSLHPKWQEMFLDQIKIIMPANTQLIIATHSPGIVGKYKHKCIPLMY